MPIVSPEGPIEQMKGTPTNTITTTTTTTTSSRRRGVIVLDDFMLQIRPGCLAEDTEITLTNYEQKFDFKSLVHLDLVAALPRVVEFLPNGLKFLEPANLTIRLKKSLQSNFEPFVLHGFYDDVHQKVIWELVTSDVTHSNEEGQVNVKINGFCFFSYILAKRGLLARILSHVNHSFTCCAYVLYRRQGLLNTISIAVVMISEFVEDGEEENIKQLKDHFKEGYERGEKGMLKRVHTNRRLVLRLDFSGVASTCSLGVDQAQLDSVGFVVDHFKGIAIKRPVSGTVKISEARGNGSKLLWNLGVSEQTVQETKIKEAHGN